MTARDRLIDETARLILARGVSRLIVAVDGVDGAGKTTFADELAEAITGRDRCAVRASVDGFHNPRAVRYRRGRDSREGFFHDSYDYDALKAQLLAPFRDGADRIRTARFDHRTDTVVNEFRAGMPGDAILIVDGIFLHRDEMVDQWDWSVFLQVPFEVSYARMAARDGSDPSPDAPGNRRYLQGQHIYLRLCDPANRATIVIDNEHIASPFFVKGVV